MGGRHGSAHYHTATLQMASITVECAELAVASQDEDARTIQQQNTAAIRSFAPRDRHVRPPATMKRRKSGKTELINFTFSTST